MNELATSLTSLPNLHPAIVHFPIALAFAALLFELLGAVTRRPWTDSTCAALWLLAATGAGVAYLAGRQAARTVHHVAPSAEAVMADHANLALWSLLVLVVLAAARVMITLHDGDHAEGGSLAGRLVLILFALVACGLLAATADLGGALVFRHGVAVAQPNLPPKSAPVSHSDPEVGPGDPGAASTGSPDNPPSWHTPCPTPSRGRRDGSAVAPAPTDGSGARAAGPGTRRR